MIDTAQVLEMVDLYQEMIGLIGSPGIDHMATLTTHQGVILPEEDLEILQWLLHDLQWPHTPIELDRFKMGIAAIQTAMATIVLHTRTIDLDHSVALELVLPAAGMTVPPAQIIRIAMTGPTLILDVLKIILLHVLVMTTQGRQRVLGLTDSLSLYRTAKVRNLGRASNLNLPIFHLIRAPDDCHKMHQLDLRSPNTAA